MDISNETRRFIFGIKLKQARQQANFSLTQLAERTGLSVSYLSEIEKGKKHPKPEKITLLARALNTSSHHLISLQLEDPLTPLTALLNSPLLKQFPLKQFGIGLNDLYDLVNDSPSRANAFLRTLIDIIRGYDMNVEQFLLASLRSYQKLHLNYFKELECAALEFRHTFDLATDQNPTLTWLEQTLTTHYNCRIKYDDFTAYEALKSLRSICKSPNHLWINSRLTPEQKKFIISRELGFRYLKLTERTWTSTWVKVDSFDQILNNFKASYFAGALLIPEKPLVKRLKTWLNQANFNAAFLGQLIQEYCITAEMLLYRMSSLLPSHFGIEKMHYMRLQHDPANDRFAITKELNLTHVFVPRSIAPGEHHCRRWAATAKLQHLARSPHQRPSSIEVTAQRSHFTLQNKTFFNIAIVDEHYLENGRNTGMTLGFLIDSHFKQTAKFWNDPNITDLDVNETCERCGFEQCANRAAAPTIYTRLQTQHKREHALRAFMEQHQ